MKALKSHPQIERPRRINSQITLAKYTAGLVLALVGLISAALMKGTIQPASAETVALGWSYTGFIRLSRVLWLSVLVVMLGGLLEPEAAAQTVSFGARTDFGTGGGPFAVGDFNGDGKLDLAVANINDATVSILLNTTVYRIANSVSAASFQGGTLAAGAIAAAFGSGLATQTLAAELPLPTTLAGTQVRVRDSAGIERLAPIFFVSPGQVNYLLPEGISAGRAEVSITSGAGVVSSGLVQIASVAPGIFSANSNGSGVVAGYITRVRAGVITCIEDVTMFDATKNQYTARAVDLGPANEEVFLTLFGTGIRHRTSLAGVVVRVGGEEQQVTYADVQGIYVGLDQINLRLARSLAERGEVDIVLTVDGKIANTITVNIS